MPSRLSVSYLRAASQCITIATCLFLHANLGANVSGYRAPRPLVAGAISLSDLNLSGILFHIDSELSPSTRFDQVHITICRFHSERLIPQALQPAPLGPARAILQGLAAIRAAPFGNPLARRLLGLRASIGSAVRRMPPRLLCCRRRRH